MEFESYQPEVGAGNEFIFEPSLNQSTDNISNFVDFNSTNSTTLNFSNNVQHQQQKELLYQQNNTIPIDGIFGTDNQVRLMNSTLQQTQQQSSAPGFNFLFGNIQSQQQQNNQIQQQQPQFQPQKNQQHQISPRQSNIPSFDTVSQVPFNNNFYVANLPPFDLTDQQINNQNIMNTSHSTSGDSSPTQPDVRSPNSDTSSEDASLSPPHNNRNYEAYLESILTSKLGGVGGGGNNNKQSPNSVPKKQQAHQVPIPDFPEKESVPKRRKQQDTSSTASNQVHIIDVKAEENAKNQIPVPIPSPSIESKSTVIDKLLKKMNSGSGDDTNDSNFSNKPKRKRGAVQKQKHNVAEKRRRVEMNDALERIKTLLPHREDEKGKQATKVSVLTDAADYIESMQSLCVSLAENNQNLTNEVERLKNELLSMRASEEWSEYAPGTTVQQGDNNQEGDVVNNLSEMDQHTPKKFGFASTILLTIMFFAFWGKFVSIFNLNEGEYGLGRVLLSLPTDNVLLHFVNTVFVVLGGFFYWFKFVLAFYVIALWQVKYVEKGSQQYHRAVKAIQELSSARLLGTNRAFKLAIKSARLLNRRIPKSGPALAFALGFNIIRRAMIKIYVGYWIERLIFKFKGISTEDIRDLISLEVAIYQTLIDCHPRTGPQFWYITFLTFNQLDLIPRGTDIKFRDGMLKVKTLRIFSTRLKHHFAYPIRKFSESCDLEAVELLKEIFAKSKLTLPTIPSICSAIDPPTLTNIPSTNTPPTTPSSPQQNDQSDEENEEEEEEIVSGNSGEEEDDEDDEEEFDEFGGDEEGSDSDEETSVVNIAIEKAIETTYDFTNNLSSPFTATLKFTPPTTITTQSTSEQQKNPGGNSTNPEKQPIQTQPISIIANDNGVGIGKEQSFECLSEDAMRFFAASFILSRDLTKSIDEGRIVNAENISSKMLSAIETAIQKISSLDPKQSMQVPQVGPVINAATLTRTLTYSKGKIIMMLALAELSQGKSDIAIQRLVDLLEHTDSNTEMNVQALVLLAVAFSQTNQTTYCKRIIDHLQEKYGDMSKHPNERISLLAVRAHVYQTNGDYVAAIKDLETALKVFKSRRCDHTFQTLCGIGSLAKVSMTIWQDIQARYANTDAAKEDPLYSRVVNISEWLVKILGLASTTSQFFAPTFHHFKGMFEALSGKTYPAQCSFQMALKLAKSLDWQYCAERAANDAKLLKVTIDQV